MVKSSSEYLLWSSANPGFSTRHGAHQEAQKSIKIYLDLIPYKEITSPSKPGPENFGAKDPITGASVFYNLKFSIIFLTAKKGDVNLMFSSKLSIIESALS